MHSQKLSFVHSAPWCSVSSKRSAFVSSLRARQLSARTKNNTKACLPNHSTAKPEPPHDVSENDISPTPEISRTEQIAAMLGKSKESLEESRDWVLERDRKDKRKRYTGAFVSILLGTAAFLAQKLDPNSGVTLLRYMYEHSDSPSVIGTNNKPSLIEFSTTWCSNCKASARGVFDLENKYMDQVNFLIFNGDDPKNAEILDRYSVDGIPQFSMISRDGTVKGNLVGRIPRDILAEDLDALLEERDLPFPGLPLEQLRSDSSG
ncbi:Thioredoxin [Gracilaria domingensis]|nr:Thioredoxin [Gracilaria domingensis]